MQDSDIEEEDLDRYYCQIMNRAWMSLIAAGHQVKEMKVYILLEQEYGINDDIFIDNWLGNKEEIRPIWPMNYGESIPNALSEISKSFDKGKRIDRDAIEMLTELKIILLFQITCIP
jgi:hypothetical protein